jgi:hypothetical protein
MQKTWFRCNLSSLRSSEHYDCVRGDTVIFSILLTIIQMTTLTVFSAKQFEAMAGMGSSLYLKDLARRKCIALFNAEKFRGKVNNF